MDAKDFKRLKLYLDYDLMAASSLDYEDGSFYIDANNNVHILFKNKDTITENVIAMYKIRSLAVDYEINNR